MPTDSVTFQDSGYFSKLIIDYLNQKPELNQFYNRFASLNNFAAQMNEKANNYNHNNRKILVDELTNQYLKLVATDTTLSNIKLLQNSSTFTITTGHQLNLFTGPMYFLYKIVSTINLCDILKKQHPENHFVPIYWMASEDHDFEEINYFNLKGKKIRWQQDYSGAVGRLSTNGLEAVLNVFEKELGNGENANFLKELFKNAYIKNSNLADATRFVANELFGQYGLVILDPDSHKLKNIFKPYIKKELLQQKSCEKVSKTIDALKDYNVQVNPREINLFYIDNNLRERITIADNIYKINNTETTFTKTEILHELELFPEKFSPNVILRPLYQEIILPNLSYIGGGGEIAYWLELKTMFENNEITFPLLLLRNSVLIVTKKQVDKANNLDLKWLDLFKKQDELIKNQTIKKSTIEIDFTFQKKQLQQQFQALHELAKQTDKSFVGAVKAQETKQIKGLENLEKRLLRAQKRVLHDELNRITDLQNQLFPNKGLQERQLNFSEFYLEYGDLLIQKLMKTLKPTVYEFVIVDF